MSSNDFNSNGIIAQRHSAKDIKSYELLESAFNETPLRTFDKLEAFPRFISKRSLARFLCKYEIYKKIIEINGVIIECGVFNGAGLFTWAQLANIFEPTNYNRKIIGFDTFEGFPSVTDNDNNDVHNAQIGGVHGDSYENFFKSIEKYNAERALSHIPNIELIKGDFSETAPTFIESNKHLLISLLYLDFDLYGPTKKALEIFRSRMCKGAIICFDELNCSNFPGETIALLEEFDLAKYSIKRFPTDPWLSYIEL